LTRKRNYAIIAILSSLSGKMIKVAGIARIAGISIGKKINHLKENQSTRSLRQCKSLI
jgi:hypothetical protein